MSDLTGVDVACAECGIDEPVDTNVLHSGGRILCLGCAEECDCQEVRL